MTYCELRDVVSRWEGKRVLVIGDAMLDIEVQGTFRGPNQETGGGVILQEKQIFRYPGGAANVAMNMHSLGAQVKLLAPIGQDDSGAWLIDKLKEVRLPWLGQHLLCRKNWLHTTTKTRFYREGREGVLRLDRDARATLPMADVCRLIDQEQFDLIAFSDYQKGAFAENPQAAINRFRNRNPQGKIAANPKPVLAPRFEGIDLLSMNDAEYRDLRQGTGCIADLREHLDVGYLIHTEGRRGLTIVNRQRTILHVPAHDLEMKDPVGAGDASFAAAALALLATEDQGVIGTLANAAGAAKVAKKGTHPVQPGDLNTLRGCRPPSTRVTP